MANFTAKNLSTDDVTVTKMTFTDPAGIIHTADLTNFGGFLSGASSFTDFTTEQITAVTNHVWDTLPVTVNFVGTATTIVTYEVVSATISGGTGYGSTQTFNLTVITSDGTAVLNVTSDAVGAVDTVNSVVDGGTFTGISAVTSVSGGTGNNDAVPVLSYGPLSTNNYVIIEPNTYSYKIRPGWVPSPPRYVSGQSVVAVTSSTWLQISDLPDNEDEIFTIQFSTSTILLEVDSTAGIVIGDRAQNNGYALSPARTVTNIIDSTTLEMSGYPNNGTPEVGLPITFYSAAPITVMSSGTDITFSLEYDRTTSNLNTYYANVKVHALVYGLPAVRTVSNTIILYTGDPPEVVIPPTYIPPAGDGAGDGDGYSAPSGTGQDAITGEPGGTQGTDPGSSIGDPAADAAENNDQGTDAGGGTDGAGDSSTDTGYCLGKHTLVLTSYGWKEINTLTVGDKVLSGINNEETEIVEIHIIDVGSKRLFKINDLLVVTGTHLVATTDGWACARADAYINRKEKTLPNDSTIDIYQIPLEKVSLLTEDSKLLTIDGEIPIRSLTEIPDVESEIVYAIATKSGTIVCDSGIIVEAYGGADIERLIEVNNG